MWKSSRSILTVVLILTLGWLAWSIEHASKLTTLLNYRWESWEGRSSPQERAAKEALVKLGTNAPPALVKMLNASDSRFQAGLVRLTQRLGLISITVYLGRHSAGEYHWMASEGFRLLGSSGGPATPGLIDSLKSSDENVREIAAGSLGDIGAAAKDAVPALIKGLTDADRRVQITSIVSLGLIHSEPSLAVPALVKNLNTNSTATIMALGLFGVQAKDAIPAIRAFLTNQNLNTRISATNALKLISPETSVQMDE